jgi:hypothetical protein
VMSGLSTETLSWMHDVFKLAGWVLGAVADVALASDYFVNRELDRRKAEETKELKKQVATSQQATERAESETRALGSAWPHGISKRRSGQR